MDINKSIVNEYVICPDCIGTGKIKIYSDNTNLPVIKCATCDGQRVLMKTVTIEYEQVSSKTQELQCVHEWEGLTSSPSIDFTEPVKVLFKCKKCGEKKVM